MLHWHLLTKDSERLHDTRPKNYTFVEIIYVVFMTDREAEKHRPMWILILRLWRCLNTAMYKIFKWNYITYK